MKFEFNEVDEEKKTFDWNFFAMDMRRKKTRQRRKKTKIKTQIATTRTPKPSESRETSSFTFKCRIASFITKFYRQIAIYNRIIVTNCRLKSTRCGANDLPARATPVWKFSTFIRSFPVVKHL